MQKKPSNTEPQVIFANINADETPTQVQSECVQCQQKGKTLLLMTKIPFFREVIISSFICDNPECGYRNNDIQFAGKLPDYGVNIMFRAMDKADLNRDVIKSEHAKIQFEELDFEIPTAKAEITTIEGLMKRTYDELNFHQPLRKVHEPENYEKLEVFLEKLKTYIDGEKFPLTVRIADPSGNSIIKNPYAPKMDKNMEVAHTQRTLDELLAMGFNKENALLEIEQINAKRIGTKINFTKPFEENNFMEQEAVSFEVPCHSCQIMGEMKMCQTSVPYFTDMIVMSFKCEYCGAHSTEVKNSGQIKENASVITLSVEGDDDLKRDLFKSETCSVKFPEIELELQTGTLGGVFTTVEGLIEKIGESLGENNPFLDSDPEFAGHMAATLKGLKEYGEGGRKFTMILTDALGHSFISNPYHPNEDKRCKIETRPRTFEENEELGINDIKTENYQKGSSEDKKAE